MNLSKILQILLIIFLGLMEISKSEDEKDTWISDRLKIIDEAKISPDENSIKKLGDIIRPLGRDLRDLKPETRAVFDEAQAVILTIPGHAEYYGNEIKNLTDKEIAGTSTVHSSTRTWYFETLSRLPSPEAIKVLGELLFDERSPWDKEYFGDGGAPRANSLHAVDALYEIGLKNPPVHGPFSKTAEDLRTWQLWYEQVRAGTRTFSFKGSDTVYTLAGPVIEAPTSSSATNPQPTAAPLAALTASSSFPKLPMAIALVILLTAIFAVVTKSKKRSSKS